MPTIPVPHKKDPAAVRLGRRGGLARDPFSIPAEQRIAIARHAAKTRWAKRRKPAKTLVKQGA